MNTNQVSKSFANPAANFLDSVGVEENQGVRTCPNLPAMQKPKLAPNMSNESVKIEGPIDVKVEASPKNGPGSIAHATKSCCERFKDFFKDLWSKCKNYVKDGVKWIEDKMDLPKLTGVKRFFAGLGSLLGGAATALVGLGLGAIYFAVVVTAAVVTALLLAATVCLAGGAGASSRAGGAVALTFVGAIGVGAAILASPGIVIAGGLTAAGLGIKNMVNAVQGTANVVQGTANVPNPETMERAAS